MTKTFYPFLFLVFSIFLLLCSPYLLSEGMFMDGLMYATVSRNLAEGEGSFWALKFSDVYLNSFHEHPPLAYGLQSICYSVFGDSIYVDRLYSWVMCLLSAWVIILIWKKITIEKYHSYAWFPLLLWVVMPLTTWGAVNNMLENTMLFFVLWCVYFIIKNVQERKVFFLLAASFSLAAAFFSKGFTGLFPLSFPFFIFCFKKDYPLNRAFIDTLLLLLFCTLIFSAVLILQEDSWNSLLAYYETQVLNSLANVQTVETRFFILGKLFTESLIPLAIIIILAIINRKQKKESNSNEWLFILLCLGLSGVLPIMLSLKQNGHYLLTTLPLFAMVLALLALPSLSALIDKIQWTEKKAKLFLYFSIVVLIVSLSLVFVQKGEYSRDEQLIADIKQLKEILPSKTICSTSISDFNNWGMQAYLYRYHHISLDIQQPSTQKYFLTEGSKACPEGYSAVSSPLKRLRLFQKK